jgi:hypothetical protein
MKLTWTTAPRILECLLRPSGADELTTPTYPRVALRFTRGYGPLPRRGKP